METLSQIVIAAVIAVSVWINAWELGRYFTEEVKPLYPVKPFTCRRCLTFWICLILGAVCFAAAFGVWYGLISAPLAFAQDRYFKNKFKVV